ncbi:MAG: hypothetical protein K0Q57_1004, partial [Gammaproteobacteria bacterium]|nr:hypothetical protein [Gammaproteobacteria bacterium]
MKTLFKKPTIWYWIVCLICFIWQVIYYRHFYYYHADTGWELYSIWAATQGLGHTDFLMSWRAGYLYNVPFVHYLGFNLYGLRILFLCSWLMSITVFVAGFDKKFIKTEILPAALIVGILFPCYYTDFIVDYYTAPPMFLALALGLFWIGLRQSSKTAEALILILAGLSLALSALSNIGIFPASILAAIIIVAAYRNRQAVFFALSYAVFLAALAYCYFKLFGIAHLLSQPAALGSDNKTHIATWLTLAEQVAIGSFFFVMLAVGVLSAIALYLIGHKNESGKQTYILYIGLAIFSCLMLFLGNWQNLPALFFYYIVYCGFITSFTYLVFRKENKQYGKAILASLSIITLYYLAHRSSSNNYMGSILLNYNSLLLIVLLPLIFAVRQNIYKCLCFISLTIGTVIFITYANLYPTVGNVFANIKENTLLVPELGIKTDLATYQILQNMKQAYYSENCQDKTFFSFFDSPIAYYL